MKRGHWVLLAIAAVFALLVTACGTTPAPTPTPTPVPPTDTPTHTPTPVPPTDTPTHTPTPVPPTDTPTHTPTPVPPTDTPTPTPTHTATPEPPTDTPVPPTDTPVPPTNTPRRPTNTPVPAATPTEAAPPAPPSQGCYLFQNFLGAEVTVTLTAQDWAWSDSFTLQAGEENLYCLDPGRYTFTLDAPPPWGATSGDLVVNAGDLYLFPIRGRE